MKYIPILFSTEMVKALLEGRKTMTRRVVKPQPSSSAEFCRYDAIGQPLFTDNTCVSVKYKVGDVLWCRETFCEDSTNGVDMFYVHKAGNENYPMGSCPWRPLIFMPKQACRIFLEITEVRVERVQDISDIDVFDEGITLGDSPYDQPLPAFMALWININGPESWQSNPWVWIVSFKRINKPENFK